MKIRLLILIIPLITIIAADTLGQAPTITSISPTGGPVGSLVTITGTNLDNLTDLNIAGVTGLEISNDGANLIGFVMPGATTGTVDVTTSFGSVSSSQSFTVNNPAATPALQLGADIDGQAAGDESGNSVSLSADGLRLAVGAPGNDGTDTDAGQVRIYEWSGSAWGQVGLDINGEAAGDQSGWSVSLSADGHRVAIGALGNNGFTGHVRVYEDIAGVWTKIGDDIDGEAASDQSGYSVSLSADGQRVAIGARVNDGAGTNAGQVRIYQDNAGVWTQIGLDIDGENTNDQSAFSVSLSANGQRVAIGAPFNAGNGTRAGHVRIFEDIAGTWTQLGVDIDGEATNEEYGWSVSLSADGERVAIGATAVLTGSAGYVRIYEWSGSVWNKVADIEGEMPDDRSGISVSLSADGQRVAIGARLNAGGGIDAGHVRIYEDLAGIWTQIVDDIDGEAAGNESGRSVSLSADGKRVAIGAPYNNGNGISAGHVRAFQLVNPLNLTSSNPATNATNIAANANITLTFDFPVDGTTTTSTHIKISGELTGIIAGAFSGGGSNTITFDPTNNFKAGEVISVTVTNGVLGTNGEVAIAQTFQFIAQSQPGSGTFLPSSNLVINGLSGGRGLEAVDMDGDGDIDLLNVSEFNDEISWLENDGNQNFSERIIATGSNVDQATDIFAADFDGDGDMDVVSVARAFGRVFWWENDGSQNFNPNFVSGFSLDSPGDVIAADMDSDGDMDIVVGTSGAGPGDPEIRWFENTGSSITTSSVVTTNGNFFSDLFAADVDNDGDMDLISSSFLDATIAWYENDGNQTFTQRIITNTATNANSVYAADIDADGDLDIFGTASGTNTVYWFENNGSQTFTERNLSTKGGPSSVYVADIDGDGDMDVVTSAQVDNTVTFLINDGSQNFTEQAITTTATTPNTVTPVDLDQDGDLDIVIYNQAGNSILWFEQAFAAPTIQASNLTFSNVTSTSMTIDWTNGDGTNRIVVAKEAAAVDANPPDNTTYTADSNFGSGTEIGTGNFVVYNGNGTSVDITGLNPKVFYHFQVFEYNGTTGSEQYNTATATNNPLREWSGRPFITNWVAPADGQIIIPTFGSGYNYDVSWNNLTNIGTGDGVITEQSNSYTITGLANGDTYELRIKGDFPRIYFNNGTEKDKIRTIEEWGDIVWGPILTDSFYGCSNLTSNATDVPDLSNVTNMTTFFRNATSFNSDISQWDLSNVNFMSGMFSGAAAFNNGGQPLNWGIGVSGILNMSGVFEFASTFNQDISDWDVSSVQNMAQMFMGASDFNNANQPLTWSTNGGTANVTNMQNMFFSASSFNQDIGALDVSAVSNMSSMFNGSGLSSANYDTILEGWNSQTLQSGVQLDAPGIIYCSPSAVSARANMVATYGWTINDGGVCEPTSQANTIIFSNIGALQADISWTNGNGTNRIVLAREGSAVTTDPSDLTTYAADANFGSGTELGSGNYVVYNGTGNNFTINNLNPGSEYHFRVYEYNGTPGDENYYVATAVGNPAATSTLVLPAITGISPNRAPSGTPITISGSGFNASAPNDIFFGPVKVTATANAAGTEILVNVPAGASSVTPIIVRNNANGLQTSSVNSNTPFFTVTVTDGLSVTPSRFRTSQYTTSIISSTIAAGDFDNDGDVDLITADGTNFNDIIQFHINDGNGIFTSGTNIPLIEGSVSNLQVGDLNGDGNLDIAAGKTTTSPLELFEGNGDGTFNTFPSQPFFSTVTSGGTGLALADMNKDGNMDIITANVFDEVSVLIGDGTGNFAHASYSPFVPTGLGQHTDLKIADFNKDGFLDIVLLDDGNEQAHILLFNNGTNLFNTPISFTTAENPYRVVIGNFDGDGNLDLAIMNIAFPVVVEIYSGDGAGNFSASGSPVPIDTTPLGLHPGDFDGDGNTDLLLGGGTRTTFPLLQGNGTGNVSSFNSFPLNITPNQPFGVVSADFNNDGFADLAGAHRTNASFAVSLYVKPVITSFAPTYANIGEPITITGEDFTGVTAVSFGGTPAPFTFVSDTEITAVIAAGSPSGAVEVTTGDGTASLDGFMVSPFVTTWVTDNGSFRINTTGGGYNYDIRWTNLTTEGAGDGYLSNQTGSRTIGALANGDTYEVAISGSFPQLYLNNVFSNTGKIRSIEQWGNIEWQSLENSFYGCRNLIINASDVPDLSQVTSLRNMFQGVDEPNAFTNTDLSLWDVSTITDMSRMFYFAWDFNQDISNWDVSNVTTFEYTFGGTNFNQPLENWVFPNATNLSYMFDGTQQFNQPLEGWDVSGVTDMKFMFFEAAAFNQPLNGWDVGAVTDMSYMFYDAVFNQPLNLWDVSAVTNMEAMFYFAQAFNQPINDWNVSNVTNMYSMFDDADAFNQPLNNWDVSSVTDMTYMFYDAALFDQSLGDWDISSVTSMFQMLHLSALSADNYDFTLTGWATLDTDEGAIPVGIDLGAQGLSYCESASERQLLADPSGAFQWNITGDNAGCDTPSAATDISFSNTGLNQTEMSWTNGDGSSRIVIAKAGSIVDATPVDLITYSANASFGTAGSEIGTANFVVYNGNGNNVTVTNLNQGETYHFQLFEYNGPVGLEAYNTDPTASGNPASVTTFVPPSFTSFSPPAAGQNATVTLEGSNFTGATSVSFGGTPATFMVDSDSQISAQVGSGSSGIVSITTPGGTSNLSNFIFIPAPVINSFTPPSATAGETVIIEGTDFSNASTILIAGVNVTSFNVNSDSEIAAVVPAGGSTSGISVTTPGGTVSITGFSYIATPEIDIFEGASNLATNATLNFEDIMEGTSTTKILTIDNPGPDDLVISDIQLTDGTAFTVSGITLPATIVAGTSADFTLTFSSSVVQGWNDVLSISSNDSNENPFILNLEGTVIPTPVPEIELSNASVSLASSDNISFVDLLQNETSDQVLTISNAGTADLVVSDIQLTEGTAFAVSGITLPVTVASGTSINFTLAFSSAVAQNWTDVLSISSNDSNENPFVLNLEGTIIPIPVPEIEVSNASVNLASNDVISFADLVQNDASDRLLTIANTGTADLEVSDIQLTTGTAFSITGLTLPTTIAAGTSVDFTLRFSNAVAQNWTDALSISSNDSDENPFVLNLEGTIIPTPVPEIEVSNASVSLASNDVISFADLLQDETSDQVLTISNSGTADLVVSAIQLTEGTAFAVSGITLPATVAAGTSIDFTLTFSNEVAQVWNDVLSISSNDSDENPFILNVTGTIIPLPTPQIEVRQQSELINGVVQFGTVNENSDVSLSFDILNVGTSSLLISEISSSSSKFTSSGINLPLSISAGQSNSFDLILSTNQVGNFESTISISSNDPDQEVFSFNVRAIVSGGRAVIIITNPDNSTDRIVISDEDVDLGQTSFNLNIERLFGIENLSDTEELTIEDITTNNPLFTISNVPKSIPAGGWEQFSVTLNSKKIGLNRSTITVTSSINDFSFNVIAEVISEEEPQLITYNLVTPNGDGKHDLLFIENIDLYPNNSVSIFNRLGNKVFEISNYDNTTQIFEGISSSGQELITGNYYYVIDKGDGSKRISGFLLIKR